MYMVRLNAVLHALSFVIVVIAGVLVIPWLVSIGADDGASDSFFKAIGLTLMFGYIFWRMTRKRIDLGGGARVRCLAFFVSNARPVHYRRVL
jgi:hypothetical protein